MHSGVARRQFGRGVFAGGAAGVVFRVDQIVFLHRIDHQNRATRSQRHRLHHFDGAEVGENHPPGYPENRTELVEQSGLEPEIVIFHALADPRQLRPGELQLEFRAQCEEDRGFQRGRARHARRERDRAGNHRIESAGFRAAPAQFGHHAGKVAEPFRCRLPVQLVEVEAAAAPGPQVVNVGLARTVGGQDDRGALIHGAAEYDAFIVIGMVAQDFQPSRRRREDCRRLAEPFLKCRGKRILHDLVPILVVMILSNITVMIEFQIRAAAESPRRVRPIFPARRLRRSA
ncbi:hypothetical protein SDC9_135194 [bioreactor metagenome]|uniref:Uncharacterized protein n=1 Tax=bioreactor metagenome TaxID=1076179 RepID=A0A645DGZ3_9ZZZZ